VVRRKRTGISDTSGPDGDHGGGWTGAREAGQAGVRACVRG
jgi:hypothetical protein